MGHLVRHDPRALGDLPGGQQAEDCPPARDCRQDGHRRGARTDARGN